MWEVERQEGERKREENERERGEETVPRLRIVVRATATLEKSN